GNLRICLGAVPRAGREPGGAAVCGGDDLLARGGAVRHGQARPPRRDDAPGDGHRSLPPAAAWLKSGWASVAESPVVLRRLEILAFVLVYGNLEAERANTEQVAILECAGLHGERHVLWLPARSPLSDLLPIDIGAIAAAEVVDADLRRVDL